jgi:hypothetical protein
MVKRTFNDKFDAKKFLKKSAEEAACGLVSILNTPDHEGPPEMIEQIRELKAAVLALSELFYKAHHGEFFHPDETIPINAALARYKWVTAFVPTNSPGYMTLYSQSNPVNDDLPVSNGDLPVSMSIDRNAPGFGLPWPQQIDFHWLSAIIVNLATEGLLERVRRCPYCQKWFFAKRADRFFCSAAHRQAVYKSTPAFQEKASEYQANYYRKHLSPNKDSYRKGMSPADVRELKRKRKRTRRISA